MQTAFEMQLGGDPLRSFSVWSMWVKDFLVMVTRGFFDVLQSLLPGNEAGKRPARHQESRLTRKIILQGKSSRGGQVPRGHNLARKALSRPEENCPTRREISRRSNLRRKRHLMRNIAQGGLSHEENCPSRKVIPRTELSREEGEKGDEENRHLRRIIS